jgi:tetratricopeptide (TPR) repeat protein
LASLLGIGDASVGDEAELFAAFRTFFERIADRGPTVLVFEDFQWADPALLDFAEQLPEWSRNYPIFVITLSRPDLLERRPGFGQGRHGLISMHLGPIADLDMERLVDGMVPGIDATVRDVIVERAAGIPLYAVEMVRMMLSGGELTESGGRYAYSGDVGALAVPESLQAMIGARLDRLERAERELLQDCAIAGHSFTLDTLAQITGDEGDDLEERLAPLVRAELLEVNRDRLSPERGQYRFVQGLIREVAHGRISKEVRVRRHREAARYWEGFGPEFAVIVADHYLEAYDAASGEVAAGLRISARDALLAASDRAADLHSYEQARSLAQQALEATDDDAERAPIWERIARAASTLDEPEVATSAAQRAIDHHTEAGDQAGLNRAVRLLAHVYIEAGLAGRAVELLEPHLREADLSADPNLAVAASDLARAYLLNGAPNEVTAAAAEAALPALEAFELTDRIADAMITRGTALGGLGRIRQGTALVKGALELADAHGYAATSTRGRINLAFIASVHDPIIGFRAIQEAYDIARKAGQRERARFLTPLLVAWHAIRGEPDAAEAVATDPILEGASPVHVGRNLGALSSLRDWAGDHEAAERLLIEAQAALQDAEDLQAIEDLREQDANHQLFAGRFADAYQTSIAIARESERPVGYMSEPAWMAAYFTGDHTWLDELSELYRQGGLVSRDWLDRTEAVTALVDEPSDGSVRRVQAQIELMDEVEVASIATVVAAALALHGPKAEHDRFDADFRARAEKYGYQGMVDLYERLLDA